MVNFSPESCSFSPHIKDTRRLHSESLEAEHAIPRTNITFAHVERYHKVVLYIHKMRQRQSAWPIKYYTNATKLNYALDELDSAICHESIAATAAELFLVVEELYQWLTDRYEVPTAYFNYVLHQELRNFTDPVSVEFMVNRMWDLYLLNEIGGTGIPAEEFVNKIISFFVDSPWEARLAGILSPEELLITCVTLGVSFSPLEKADSYGPKTDTNRQSKGKTKKSARRRRCSKNGEEDNLIFFSRSRGQPQREGG